MSASAPVPAGRWDALRPAVPVLAAWVVVWALLFRPEIAHAVATWNASTAYGHCWFVLPIALYLAWDRRMAVAGLAPRPTLWPLLLVLPGAVVWLAAERVGIMEGRQLVAIGFLQLLFLAVLGWRLAWAFSAPLLYLFFLVPFGAFLTDDLQRFTAAFTDIGLQVSGIPFVMDRFTIEIPEGTFYIAEACAGLRFLIAAIAFGALYACLIYRSPWRRVAFMLASCVIPVIATGFRALGIIALGHILGSAQAVAADHIVYGWVFFSVVILLLILAGLPFREDRGEPPVPVADTAPPPTAAALWLAGALVAAGVLIGPAVAAAIDHAGAGVPFVPLPAFVPGPGCSTSGTQTSTWSRQDRGVLSGVQNVTCDGFPMTATIGVFRARANPARPIARRRGAVARDLAEDAATTPFTAAGVPWQLVQTQMPDHVAASALWIDGNPALGGLAGRLRQARNSLFGGDFAPVLAAVSVDGTTTMDPRQRQRAAAAIRAFLDAQDGLNGRIIALARAAAR
ncbi:MAG: exosortase [Nevskia sp.]|nr:exosortase [Nevskia sp.]